MMKKYNLIPLLLLIYLGVMCYIGYPEYAAGYYSPLRYFGVIAISLACIAGARYTLKKRYEQRQQHRDDNTTHDNS